MKKSDKKIGKRLFYILTAITILTISILSKNDSSIVKAETRSSEAKTAYNNYLNNDEQYWGSSFYDTSNFKFMVKDLNGDSVPEIIIQNEKAVTADDYERVFTYYNGEMHELAACFSGEIDKIYAKSHVFIVSGEHMGNYWKYYYKMYNGAVEIVAAIYACDYVSGHEGTKVYTYYVKGNKTTKSKLNTYTKKLIGTSQATSCKLYSNTATNRDKYLK